MTSHSKFLSVLALVVVSIALLVPTHASAALAGIPITGTFTDAELLAGSDGAALLASDDVRFDFDSEDNEDQDALPRITIANQGEEIVLRPSGRSRRAR